MANPGNGSSNAPAAARAASRLLICDITFSRSAPVHDESFSHPNNLTQSADNSAASFTNNTRNVSTPFRVQPVLQRDRSRRKDSSRLYSRIRAIASRRFARHSSRDFPWPLAPGASAQKGVNSLCTSPFYPAGALLSRPRKQSYVPGLGHILADLLQGSVKVRGHASVPRNKYLKPAASLKSGKRICKLFSFLQLRS